MATKYVSKLAKARVLVLGGTSGIGFCVAEAAVEHGATVILSSSNPDRISRALERLKTAYPDRADQVTGHPCDLAKPDTLETNLITLFEAATAGSKTIDHIVFTAGDMLQIIPLSEMTVEGFWKFGNVRLMGSLMMAKHAPKYLTPGPGSSITLTGGVNATKPSPGWAGIGAGGGAVESLMRGLALDLKPTRVNLVAPGAVLTELLDMVPADRRDGFIKAAAEATTTGEIGRPEDVAEAYIYAMKDRFVTGSVLSSNGGRLLV